MKKVLLALMLALTACSSSSKKEEFASYRSEEFGSYMRLFQLEAEKRGLNFSFDYDTEIYFVEKYPKWVDSQAIGLCTKINGRRVIQILRSAWNKSDSLQREMTFFHELGHCVVDYKHDDSSAVDGTPLSIMASVEFESQIYADLRKEYLDVFFAPIIAKLRMSTKPQRLDEAPPESPKTGIKSSTKVQRYVCVRKPLSIKKKGIK
jgi:hypothetical protein